MTSGDGRTDDRTNGRKKIENPGVGRPLLGPAKKWAKAQAYIYFCYNCPLISTTFLQGLNNKQEPSTNLARGDVRCANNLYAAWHIHFFVLLYRTFSFSHRWNTEEQLWKYSLLDKVYFLVNFPTLAWQL